MLTFLPRRPLFVAVPTNSPVTKCSIKQVIAGGHLLKIQQPAVQMLHSLTLQFTMRAACIFGSYLQHIIDLSQTEDSQLTETSAIVISGTNEALLTVTLLMFSDVG